MSDFIEAHAKFMEAIDGIDVKLDSLSGGTGATKRRVVNELKAKFEGTWGDPVGNLVGQIKEFDSDLQAAFFYAITDSLKKEFDADVSGYVKGLVDAAPKQEALISEEEATGLSKDRSALYQKVKALVEIAESIDGVKLEMPKMRRGSTGKRGPRNLSLFAFEVDGEPTEESLREIALANGYEKASELTKALRQKVEGVWDGFDTTNGEQFDNFKMVNGKMLSGARVEEEDDGDDDEETETE